MAPDVIFRDHERDAVVAEFRRDVGEGRKNVIHLIDADRVIEHRLRRFALRDISRDDVFGDGREEVLRLIRSRRVVLEFVDGREVSIDRLGLGEVAHHFHV